MKIVHILNTGKFSGAENVAIQIIESLEKEKDMHFIYMSLNGSIQNILNQKNIESYLVNKITIQTIKKMIQEIEPDILHCHDYTTSVLASLATKKRIISHLHNNSPWIKKGGIYSVTYLLSSLKYSDILLVSESIEKEYIYAKLISKKTQIIGNPIDIELIEKKSKEKIVNKRYNIAFLGRLTKAKNPLLFVKIIKNLQKEIPSISACMIGDGEMVEEVKQYICEKNLNDSIELVGFQDNPFPYLQNSQILLATSSWEGYGLFAVEALALGKPVVCTNVGGLKEIINLSCGYVCREEKELSDRCKELLLNSELYRDKSTGALNRVKQIKNKEQYMETILNIYRK